jgi:hypothetical protein
MKVCASIRMDLRLGQSLKEPRYDVKRSPVPDGDFFLSADKGRVTIGSAFIDIQVSAPPSKRRLIARKLQFDVWISADSA